MGAGARLGRGDGHRVLVRRRDGLRLAYSAEDRRRPPAHDIGLGAQSARWLLRDPHTRQRQRSLPAQAGQAQALHSSPRHWRVYR